MPLAPRKLPIQRPLLGPEEEAAVVDVLRSGWLVQGQKTAAFEARVAAYAGIAHAAASSSCTTALHLAFTALGLGPGDEVIVPSLTFIATANAVEARGARPVFCDVDPRSFTATAGDFAKALTPRVRAVVPVSLFGSFCDIEDIRDALPGGTAIVEDAACSLGSLRRGLHAGADADVSVLSFHPRKVVTTGEGGMTLTADAGLDALIRRLRDHGAGKSDLRRHLERGGSLLPDYAEIGFNYRLTDLQAALGLAQMDRLGAILKARRQIAAWYFEALAGLDFLVPPQAPPGDEPNWQSFVCLVGPGEGRMPALSDVPRLNPRRNRVMLALEEDGVSTRQGTHAVHTLTAYAGKYGPRQEDYPKSLICDRLSVSLPLYPGMSREDVLYVAERLKVRWASCAA